MMRPVSFALAFAVCALAVVFEPALAQMAQTQTALAQAALHFDPLPQCPDADIYVEKANSALRDPSVKGYHLIAGYALLQLGDAFVDCAKRWSYGTPSDPFAALASARAATMRSAIARYASSLQFMALYRDIHSPSAIDLFVSAANGTLYDTAIIKRADDDSNNLRMASLIESNISDLAMRYARNRTADIYNGLPK
jgi:hypothetical protein